MGIGMPPGHRSLVCIRCRSLSRPIAASLSPCSAAPAAATTRCVPSADVGWPGVGWPGVGRHNNT
eukprot:363843-Chlamydomonas_euryale.AAC.4